MSQFEQETGIESSGDGEWSCHLSDRWSIAGTPNGGYALSPVLRALGLLSGHPHPLTVTAHFLRPAVAGAAGTVAGRTIRSGRSSGTATAALVQDGAERLVALGGFTSATGGTDHPELEARPPSDLPEPDDCVAADALEEGVEITIGSRIDVRLAPWCATPGGSGRAELVGWIRLADGSPPSAMALPLFADAFPPSLYARLGRFGWVPTVELTVQVIRVPAPGWMRATFRSEVLADGRTIESGTLWDTTDRVVATSRQLALVRTTD